MNNLFTIIVILLIIILINVTSFRSVFLLRIVLSLSIRHYIPSSTVEGSLDSTQVSPVHRPSNGTSSLSTVPQSLSQGQLADAVSVTTNIRLLFNATKGIAAFAITAT